MRLLLNGRGGKVGSVLGPALEERGYELVDSLATAEAMAQQAPLSTSVSVASSGTCPLTLADGFVNCGGAVASTFGVDPNLRVGYAQTWDLSMQRDLPGAMVGTITYLGVKVNEQAAVHFAGQASPNLFAAGEIMAGNVLGQGYTAGVGMTIGTAFGRIAGTQAAAAALGGATRAAA